MYVERKEENERKERKKKEKEDWTCPEDDRSSTWPRPYQFFYQMEPWNALARFFIFHKARSGLPRETRKDVITPGEAIIQLDPVRTFTGSCSSMRRVESSAIVESRGILPWMSSKKIKTLRRHRRSCLAGWSSPLAVPPPCATRPAPGISFPSFLSPTFRRIEI